MPCDLLILGLDGATFDVLGPLMAEGRCPHLSSLAARGIQSPLLSTVPPMTAAAWSAFLTGKGPGGTGIASFRHLDLSRYSGYDPAMVTSADLRGANWLEVLSREGISVSSVGLPMTGPPFPIRGVLVSGFPRPQRREAPVLPSEMAHRWGRWDRPRDASTHHLEEGKRALACAFWDRRHLEVSLDLLRERRDRVHVCVFSGSDHMAHLFMRHHRGGGRWRGALSDHYALLDGFCGALMAAAGPSAQVLVVSDHGFGPAETGEVHLDRWLHQEGWLTLRREAGGPPPRFGSLVGEVRRRVPKGVWKQVRDRLPGGWKTSLYEQAAGRERVDWGKTRAYRVGLYTSWEGLHLNVRGRQKEGCIEQGLPHREARDDLLRQLSQARRPDGSPLVREVRRGEDVWPGERSGRLPDLLVRLFDGERGGGGLPPGEVLSPVPEGEIRKVSGTHRERGIFLAAGPGIVPGASLEDPAIVDIMPTVLYLLGLAVPEDVEGRPLLEMMEPSHRPAVKKGPPLGPPGQVGTPPSYSPIEAEGIEKALRGLGYL